MQWFHLLKNEIVTKRKWIAQEDFIDLLAISQSAPGILAVNISIFIGYKLWNPGKYYHSIGNNFAVFHYYIGYRPVLS